MANKTISDLTFSIDSKDSDVLLIEDGSTTMKITKGALLQECSKEGHGHLISDIDTLQEALDDKLDYVILAPVATSGSYADLTDTPTIPTKVSELQNDNKYLVTVPSEYITEQELADVATSGEYIDLINRPFVIVEECGAIGNGTTDDTIAIQAAIDKANREGGNVKLQGKTYLITTSLKIPSKFVFEGVEGKTKIKMRTGVNEPILTHTGTIAGKTIIQNMSLEGNETSTENHGIYINDYYSVIKNVEIIRCGGCGIKWHTTGATGTLVENRVENVKVRDCKGTSFAFGEADNNQITDGFLINCISQGTKTNKALMINSGAGWVVNGLHTYGHKNCTRVVEINNAFSTSIDNIYVEDFTERAIHLGKIQNNLNLSNITVRVEPNEDTNNPINKCVFYLNKSTVLGYKANISMQNIVVENKNNATTYIVDGDGTGVDVQLSHVNVCGTGLDYQLASSTVKNMVKYFSTVYVQENNGALKYNDFSIPVVSHFDISGGTEKNISFIIPSLPGYTCRPFRIVLRAYENYTGSKLIEYDAEGLLVRKNDTSYTIKLVENITPTGFTTNPTLNYSESGLTLTYQPSVSTAYGRGFIEFVF